MGGDPRVDGADSAAPVDRQARFGRGGQRCPSGPRKTQDCGAAAQERTCVVNIARRIANANNDNEGKPPRVKHGAPAAQKLARKVNRAAVREEKRRALKEHSS